MQKNKTILKFLQSVVMMPLIITSLPYQISQITEAAVETKQVGQVEMKRKADNALATKQAEEAAKIDAFFRSKGMPLAGYGEKMVEEAYKNGIDPFLLPAISVRESTGGKFACKSVDNQPFGWGGCTIGFATMDKAIETVAKNLGGHNPRTARYYKDKSTADKLQAYNPNSIVDGYYLQVMAIMDTIESQDVSPKILVQR